MATITPARKNITVEETRYRASISEATMNKFGGAVNFVNERQNDKHAWHLNGPYSLGVGSTGPDGIFPCLFNMEIVGFAYFNGKTGSSGTTTIDIRKLDGAGVDVGSIFSTLPSVDSTAANNSTTIYDVINATTISSPTGHTLGVLSTTQFNAGDVLRLDLNAAMIGANNFQFLIFFRPI